MKRLIYAPKVYIFIRSSNLGGRIYDVSSDVVSGSVTQNMNDLSKAQFSLRNRYQKWIRDDDDGSKSIFLPMDLVTIWLQRVAGRPVQVFTGYLDSVPYYQGFPGDARFEASCTLKRLAYTWFDPGLDFFAAWVRTADSGWIYDPTSGEASSGQFNTGGITEDQSGGPDKGAMHDAGFAALLGRFMIDVAGWAPEDVLISELPKDLPKAAARLYSDIHDGVNADLAGLAQFLGQAMGVPGYSGVTDGSETTSDGKSPNSPTIVKTFNKVNKVAKAKGIPILVLSLAAYLLTGYEEKYNHDKTEGDLYGYGLYAMRPDKATGGNKLPGPGSKFGNSIALTAATIGGRDPKDLTDATVATTLFCDALKKKQAKYLQGALKNDPKAITDWIGAALGRPLPLKGRNLTKAFAQAKQYAHSSVVVTPPNTPSPTVKQTQVDFDSPAILKLLTQAEKNVLKKKYSNAKPWLASFIQQAKKVSPRLMLTSLSSSADSIAFTSTDQKALKSFFESMALNLDIDSARLTLNGKVTMMIGGSKSSLPDDSKAGYADAVFIHQSKKPPNQDKSTSAAGSDSAAGKSGSASLEQFAAFSANAAFAANFAFPADQIESLNLTGNRALMNDVSCLDGVKQFCQASMRTFRSMPDGRFLAFYPDYFGAGDRKAYWSIYDIEIINMGIQLNDNALATHVYVIGDTGAGEGLDFLDRATTRGVATLTQAFMLNSFITPYEKEHKGSSTEARLGRLQDAFAFLEHYGARPHKEEQPLIRNTAYEFLLAWQRFMQLWASTFATNVDFTFQPEVMAGGLIEFPDHFMQMYCESVTHNFSYTNGFSTSAVMSAPSLTKPVKNHMSMPGFALGGNINTVGP